MVNDSAFVDALSQRLKTDLPGAIAHRKMLPRLGNGEAIRIKHDEQPRSGAVMILIYQEQGTLRFPLIQRPDYPGIHSGQMALPGGKSETSDRDLIETALRETSEEIGIESGKVKILGNLSSFFVAASNFQILPVVGFMEKAPEYVPDNHEVAEVVVAKLEDLTDPDKRKEKEITAGRGVKLISPYFDLSGKVVWGATAMMLSEMSAVLNDVYTSIR